MRNSSVKSLFIPKYFTYSDEASKLDQEVRDATTPIITRWMSKGYNPKEIEYIMRSSVGMEILMQHAKLNCKIAMAERNKNK